MRGLKNRLLRPEASTCPRGHEWDHPLSVCLVLCNYVWFADKRHHFRVSLAPLCSSSPREQRWVSVSIYWKFTELLSEKVKRALNLKRRYIQQFYTQNEVQWLLHYGRSIFQIIFWGEDDSWWIEKDIFFTLKRSSEIFSCLLIAGYCCIV